MGVQMSNAALRSSPSLLSMEGALISLAFPSVAMAFHSLIYGHNNQRLAQLALLGLSVVYLCLRPSLLCWPLRSRVSVPLLLFFLFGIASARLAYAPLYAFLDVGVLFLLLIGGLAIGRAMSRNYERSITWILAIIAIGCAAYLLQVGIGYAIFMSQGRMPHVGDLIHNFENYRSFNYAQTITLPMLVLLCSVATRRIVKVSAGAVTVFWWALLLATGGRGVMLGIAAGFLIVILLRRGNAKLFCLTMLITGLLGYLLNLIIFAGLPLALGMEPFGLLSGLSDRTLNDTTSGRTALWQRCVEMIVSHPILGIGPMQFAHSAIDLKIASSPHNWIMQFGAEWGLPALACLLMVVFGAAATLVRCAASVDNHDHLNQQIATALIAIGTAVLVDGLVSGLIILPVSQLLIATYIGCASGWVWSRTFRHSAVFPQRSVLSAAMLMASLAVYLGVTVDLPSILGYAEIGSPGRAANMYYPRFWLDGSF